MKRLLTLAFVALPVFSSTMLLAASLVDDHYAGELVGRRMTRGPWEVVDGTARCKQDDELFKKNKDHGPVIWYDAKFQDAVICFQYKPEELKTFVFTVNGAEGHVFRFVTSTVGTTVVAFPPEDQEHKSTALSRSGPKLKPGAWTSVVVELQGPKAKVKIGDDYTAEVEHPSLAREKTVVGLGFSFGTLHLKDFSVMTP